MRAKFIECSDAQANWGSGEDPRKHLVLGEVYVVDDVEVHSMHTLYYINGVPFNSVCFKEIEESGAV